MKDGRRDGGAVRVQCDVPHAEIGGVEKPLLDAIAIHAEDAAHVVGLKRIKQLTGLASAGDAGDRDPKLAWVARLIRPKRTGHELRAAPLRLPSMAMLDLGSAFPK
jgi:hypothetical protein